MAKTEICKWKENENGAWETECGEIFEFTAGTPRENGFNHCVYCGKKLVPVKMKGE